MRTRINSCDIAAILWSAITLIYALVSYSKANGPVPLHWNLSGEADRWGSPAETLILPICLFTLTVAGVVAHLFIKQERYRDFFIRDAITFGLLVLDGYLGALCVSSGAIWNESTNQIWTSPGNVFCIIVSISILYFAYGAAKSRRIIMPGTNGIGTCLIDLRSEKIRKVWCALIAATGITGIITSFIFSANTQISVFMGGIPGICITLLSLTGTIIAFVMSNATTQH